MQPDISLLIVDDQAVVRAGLQAFLQTIPDIHIVGLARSGAEAVALVAQHVPDVVLLDLIMPEMDGVETTRQVRLVSPHTQVIILTSYYQDKHIFPALRAGALSYLLKDIEADELVTAVRRAARGEATLHPHVAARVVQEFSGARTGNALVLSELTERELEVLRLIALGLSNAEIAERLVISDKTVKVHVSNILSKLQLSDRTRAAVLAWRHGIVETTGDDGR